MILTKTPSVTAHDAPPKPLPPHVPYAIRAKREAALRKALDGPAGHPNQKNQGGQSDRRKAWAARLPEGRFSLQDAAAAWGIDTHGGARTAGGVGDGGTVGQDGVACEAGVVVAQK